MTIKYLNGYWTVFSQDQPIIQFASRAKAEEFMRKQL